jgi:hypothetical protein
MSAQTEMFAGDAPFTHEDAIAVWRELWAWPAGPEKTIAFGKRCALACPWCEKRIVGFDGYTGGETMLRHVDACDKFVHITSARDGKEIKHVAVRAERRP